MNTNKTTYPTFSKGQPIDLYHKNLQYSVNLKTSKYEQGRSLGQEYSCRLPVDAFRAGEAGALTADGDVAELNLADMNPEDIRAELKRLYTQLEVLRNKTLRADNPHISKRRGGRKVAHRRFSLQVKQKNGEKRRQTYPDF